MDFMNAVSSTFLMIAFIPSLFSSADFCSDDWGVLLDFEVLEGSVGFARLISKGVDQSGSRYIYTSQRSAASSILFGIADFSVQSM